ncbi:MAG: GNAT family N-acetyltransferase [Pseudomonadota bacterium]
MQNDEHSNPNLSSGYLISSEFRTSDFPMITRCLQSTPWASDIRQEQVEKAFFHSLAVGARSRASQELVGFARATTDYAVYGYLTDLFVIPEVRSLGIASAMMSWLLNSEELREVTHLTLLASKPSVEALSKSHGFEKTTWQTSWLERVRR